MEDVGIKLLDDGKTMQAGSASGTPDEKDLLHSFQQPVFYPVYLEVLIEAGDDCR